MNFAQRYNELQIMQNKARVFGEKAWIGGQMAVMGKAIGAVIVTSDWLDNLRQETHRNLLAETDINFKARYHGMLEEIDHIAKEFGWE